MVEGIHAERVTAWLAAHVPALAPPVRFNLIAGGHSNLTYACTDARGTSVVLRRPPLGHELDGFGVKLKSMKKPGPESVNTKGFERGKQREKIGYLLLGFRTFKRHLTKNL